MYNTALYNSDERTVLHKTVTQQRFVTALHNGAHRVNNIRVELHVLYGDVYCQD